MKDNYSSRVMCAKKQCKYGNTLVSRCLISGICTVSKCNIEGVMCNRKYSEQAAQTHIFISALLFAQNASSTTQALKNKKTKQKNSDPVQVAQLI